MNIEQKIISYYMTIVEPLCLMTLQLFDTRPGVAFISGLFIMFLGVVFCIKPVKSYNFVGFTHTSLIMAIVFAFYISKKESNLGMSGLYSNEYFFIGILCVYVAYIFSPGFFISKRLNVLFPIIIIYLAFIDISLSRKLIFFVFSSIIFIILLFFLDQKQFIVAGVSFIGSCLITIGSTFLINLYEREKKYFKILLKEDKTIGQKFKYIFGRVGDFKPISNRKCRFYMCFEKKYMNFNYFSLAALFVTWIVAFCFDWFVLKIHSSGRNRDIEAKINRKRLSVKPE